MTAEINGLVIVVLVGISAAEWSFLGARSVGVAPGSHGSWLDDAAGVVGTLLITMLAMTQVFYLKVRCLPDLLHSVKQFQALVGSNDSFQGWLLYPVMARAIQIYVLYSLHVLYYLVPLQVVALVVDILAWVVLPNPFLMLSLTWGAE